MIWPASDLFNQCGTNSDPFELGRVVMSRPTGLDWIMQSVGCSNSYLHISVTSFQLDTHRFDSPEPVPADTMRYEYDRYYE